MFDIGAGAKAERTGEMRTLKINVRCGEKTCAEAPGRFCRFFGARIDGSQPGCALFGAPLFDENGGVEGWIQRCFDCLEADEESE